MGADPAGADVAGVEEAVGVRVGLLGWGSRGDVQPLIALGRALRGYGFEVVVAAPRNLTAMVTAAGLSVEPFGIDMDQAIASEVGRAWLEGARGRPWVEARLMDRVVQEFAPLAAEGLERVVGRCDGLISGLLTRDPALSVAEELGLPHIVGLLAPMTPTASASASMYPLLPGRGSPVNRWAGDLVGLGFRHLIRPPGDLARANLGLPPLGTARYRRLLAATPTLLGASPAVVPPPAEWRGRVAVTGYWVPDLPVNAPDSLTAFLAAGPAPVYLGFGSMPVSDPAARWSVFRSAAHRAGVRALVRFGGPWRPQTLPENIAEAPDVPHEWLFSQTAAVVHHGGAGTTAAAVRAGVPQVVVPHMGDQPYWARRMSDLGVAAAPLPLHRLDADVLAARLRTISTPGYRARAAALGERVRAEPGAEWAAELVARQWLG